MITSSGFNEIKDTIRYLEEVTFDVTRKTLYTAAELYDGFDPDDEDSYRNCLDCKVFEEFEAQGHHVSNANALLARNLHDHCIHTALARFFKEHDHRRCVGVMGGHALLRTDKTFRDIALLSKRLTEAGAVMLSGGGPGAMEATHLGAWMAGRSDKKLAEAIKMLEDAGLNVTFTGSGYVSGQSLAAGSEYARGQRINLRLRNN